MNTTNPFKEFRAKHGLTQSALGFALGVEQSAIANYESGVRRPTLEIAWRFKRHAASMGNDIALEEIYPEPDKHQAA